MTDLQPTTDPVEAARRRAAHTVETPPGVLRIARSDKRSFLLHLDKLANGTAVVVSDGEV